MMGRDDMRSTWESSEPGVWESWREGVVLEVLQPNAEDSLYGDFSWMVVDFSTGKVIASGRCDSLMDAQAQAEAAA